MGVPPHLVDMNADNDGYTVWYAGEAQIVNADYKTATEIYALLRKEALRLAGEADAMLGAILEARKQGYKP